MWIEHWRRAACVLGLACLAGCATELEKPFHSTDYLRLRGEAPGAGARDLPVACTGADLVASEPYLPMGCANALNLQRMLASPAELRRGQPMGPTLSAPLARAAQSYLSGEGSEAEAQRQRQLQRDAVPSQP
jgi:hypothetical protein